MRRGAPGASATSHTTRSARTGTADGSGLCRALTRAGRHIEHAARAGCGSIVVLVGGVGGAAALSAASPAEASSGPEAESDSGFCRSPGSGSGAASGSAPPQARAQAQAPPARPSAA
ncbi:MAG: hypothetical protein ACLT98_08345 [Eggerthellaceae bacterium]